MPKYRAGAGFRQRRRGLAKVLSQQFLPLVESVKILLNITTSPRIDARKRPLALGAAARVRMVPHGLGDYLAHLAVATGKSFLQHTSLHR